MNKKQKIIIIIIAALLVAGLGTFLAIELINNRNNGSISKIVESEDDDQKAEDYFATAEKFTMELKDGENKIEKSGVYTITGSTENGYIHINTGEDKVKLILSNVTINNQNGPAIYVESNGNVHLETVGENNLNAKTTEDLSAAIYSKADLIFKGDGILNIESDEDAINGKDDVKIKSGTINISAGDDGIKGNDSVTIQDGNIIIKKSNEAIESKVINIIGGNIDALASDDGVNASSDDCSKQAMSPTGNANITECKINITGGTLKVNANGDGLDSNGSIYLSGGTVYVDGPSNSGNGALDYDGVFEITGGAIIATGMSGMSLNASSATQGSALINLSGSYTAGQTVTIGDVTFTPTKSFNSIMVSSASFEKDKSYELKIDGQTVQTIEFSDYLVGSGNQGGPGGQGGPEGEQGGPRGSRQMMR